MFRFLKRNDSEVITPEVVDVPVETVQSNIVSFDAVKIGRNELFVACPPSQLNNPEVTITKKAVDRAYGILIHSMWGEESEDKVFEEYKRINNLML